MPERPDAFDDWPALDRAGTVWIDCLTPGRSTGRSILLANPTQILCARRPAEIEPAIRQMEHLLDAGAFVAGFIGYEAGLVLAGILSPRHTSSLPLVWLGVYQSARVLPANALDAQADVPAAMLEDLALETGDQSFLDAVDAIREHIAAGDVYQVNLTGKLSFENPHDAARLFRRLRAAHPVPHSAFVNAGDFQVLSLSPELFLQRKHDLLITRPMKGTSRRGRWSAEDRALARRLGKDEKSRAENLMIVDLMRNDLSRVCRFGSVRVRRLFSVEQYRSVLQMTSTVEGRLRPGGSIRDVLRAVLPAGSVTGAPKIRACEIIDRLETGARGVYCGQVGWFEPNGDFTLNVAIRTIVQQAARCELGVGSGIVADSNASDELAETRLKGTFVRSAQLQLCLLETLLWRASDGYAFLEEHLRRMRQSARYFGWSFPERGVRMALEKASCEALLDSRRPLARVRLLLDPRGRCETQVTSLDEDEGATVRGGARLRLSAHRTDPSDVFLFHKTTRRDRYDADRREARRLGFFDALYGNRNGEITEGAITNVLIEIDGAWRTPPIWCGLLPGIWRAQQLRHGGVRAVPVRIEDLSRARRIRAGNSVRGMIEIESVESADGDILFQTRITERPAFPSV